MAVSDGTLFILIAQIAVYALLYKNKTRLYRIIGCFAMIIVGVSSVMIEDTVPAFIFFGISAMIGGIKLFEELSYLWRTR